MKRAWRGDQVTVRIGDRVIEVEDVAFSDALDAVRAAMEASASLRALQSVLLRADPMSGRRGRVRGFQRSRSIARRRWAE